MIKKFFWKKKFLNRKSKWKKFLDFFFIENFFFLQRTKVKEREREKIFLVNFVIFSKIWEFDFRAYIKFDKKLFFPLPNNVFFPKEINPKSPHIQLVSPIFQRNKRRPSKVLCP